jgi:hypothetical protein
MPVTINDEPVTDVEVRETRIAAWTAVVDVDTDDEITGAVTIDIDGEEFVGTVVRGGNEDGRDRLSVIGGHGGLHTLLQAKNYTAVFLSAVLADIMSECGEELDPETDADVLTMKVPHWSRLQGEAATAIRAIAQFCGVQWRINRNGLVWLGNDDFVESTFEEYTVEERNLEESRISIAYDDTSDAPKIKPGVSFEGGNVGQVVTNVLGGKLRQDIYFDDADGAPAGFWNRIARFVRNLLTPEIAKSRFYYGRVVGQSGNKVSMQLDDEVAGGKWKSVRDIPIVVGLPGCTLVLPNGSRMRMFYEAGDNSRPRAALWDAGTAVEEIILTCDKLTIDGDLEVSGDVVAAGEITAKDGASSVSLSTHTHAHGTGPGTTNPPTPGS